MSTYVSEVILEYSLDGAKCRLQWCRCSSGEMTEWEGDKDVDPTEGTTTNEAIETGGLIFDLPGHAPRARPSSFRVLLEAERFLGEELPRDMREGSRPF